VLFPNPLFWCCAISALAVDQVTKFWVIAHLQNLQSVPVWAGVFHLTYATNDGAAFSFLTGQVDVLKWVSFWVSAILIWLGWHWRRWHNLEQIGYGLILGGALGNGIDRFAYGYVVDFLHLKLIKFPIFNFADVSINLGLGCLLLCLWWEQKRR
jgi:signal peptidase II